MISELRGYAENHTSEHDAAVFERVKAQQRKQLQNFANVAPYQHAMYVPACMLRAGLRACSRASVRILAARFALLRSIG